MGIKNLWCNKSLNSNQLLCSSSTSYMIFGSKILKADGMLKDKHAVCQSELIPTSLPSSGDNSNTSVCTEVFNSSPPLLTTIPPMVESSSLEASTLSSPSLHTTVEDHTFIMATPTSYFPYSSMISNKKSQFTTGPMNMHSSSLVTVTSSSSVTYTLPYSSPMPTLATPTFIHVSHTNGGVSQTSTHSSLTSPEARPSPTTLFCSELSEDGKWPKTPACTNATSTDCGNNSSHANS